MIRPRRPDATATAVATVVAVVFVAGAAVYVLHREWLGGWVSAHLTNTLFVFSLTFGLALVAACWSGLRAAYVVAGLVLVGVLAFEVSQGGQPGQAVDPVDALVSVPAVALALAAVVWVARRHLRGAWSTGPRDHH